MTGFDAFWTGVSLFLYGILNFSAYRARINNTWNDEHGFNVGGFLIGLFIAGPMFLINAKPVPPIIGVLLILGTIIHVLYSWVECWPSNVKKRDEEKTRAIHTKYELEAAQRQAEKQKAETAANALALRRQKEQQRAELARKQASADSIIVERDGVTNIAKQIVAELARDNT